jgi:hypothetical protein
MVYFMGPEGFEAALPRGGPWIDTFPVHWSSHFEGHLIHHWESNKSAACKIKDSEEVARFVCGA